MAKITVSELAKYAVDQLESGTKAPALAQQLAAYLLDTRQTKELGKLTRAIEAELNSRGTTQVTVTSAHSVSDDVKEVLAKLLGAEKPVFTEVIDSSVIGGVKAQGMESEIDLTVRARLNRFKAKVMETN